MEYNIIFLTAALCYAVLNFLHFPFMLRATTTLNLGHTLFMG